jgi:HAD superfamily hydrolase (TIGR01509 family)
MRKNEKNEIRAVLFDWDGTLLDSYHADSQAYLALFRKMGIDWGIAELTEHYSPDWYSVYRAAGLPRRHWDEADRTWREHYAQHRPRLISGARRVLAALGRRHRLGLVTSGDRSRVTRQLREFRLTTLFGARVCGGDTAQRKPHPAPLQLALRRMRLDPRVCVYVGDSPEDLQMARRAGVRAIGVLGPFPTEKRLRAEQPELLLENLARLPQALREFV